MPNVNNRKLCFGLIIQAFSLNIREITLKSAYIIVGL